MTSKMMMKNEEETTDEKEWKKSHCGHCGIRFGLPGFLYLPSVDVFARMKNMDNRYVYNRPGGCQCEYHQVRKFPYIMTKQKLISVLLDYGEAVWTAIQENQPVPRPNENVIAAAAEHHPDINEKLYTRYLKTFLTEERYPGIDLSLWSDVGPYDHTELATYINPNHQQDLHGQIQRLEEKVAVDLDGMERIQNDRHDKLLRQLAKPTSDTIPSSPCPSTASSTVRKSRLRLVTLTPTTTPTLPIPQTEPEADIKDNVMATWTSETESESESEVKADVEHSTSEMMIELNERNQKQMEVMKEEMKKMEAMKEEMEKMKVEMKEMKEMKEEMKRTNHENKAMMKACRMYKETLAMRAADEEKQAEELADAKHAVEAVEAKRVAEAHQSAIAMKEAEEHHTIEKARMAREFQSAIDDHHDTQRANCKDPLSGVMAWLNGW